MRTRAFTLIEVLVVILLLGVIAGLTAPRLFRDGTRRAESAVEAVAGVLGVIAQREALGTVRTALVYDDDERVLTLERLELPTDEEGRLVRLSRRDNGEWRPDPLAPRVPLGPVRIDEIRADAEAIDESEWRLEFVPGEPRPLVEIDLLAMIAGEERTWSVELLPYATEATRRRTGAGAGPRDRALRSIDLDAQGLAEAPW